MKKNNCLTLDANSDVVIDTSLLIGRRAVFSINNVDHQCLVIGFTRINNVRLIFFVEDFETKTIRTVDDQCLKFERKYGSKSNKKK